MENWNEQDYRNWLLSLKNNSYTIAENNNHIRFLCGPNTGEVVFYPQSIIELMITENETEETKFYLHFQLTDEAHAKDLTSQMLKTLVSLKAKKAIRVVLSCSSALTTSFFAQKLNEAVEVLKLDMSFSAVSIDRIYQEAQHYDVILLAPQIAFQYEKVKEILKDKIVLKIPASCFGQYQTGPLIDLVRTAVRKRYDEAIPEESLPMKQDFDNPYRILVICMINHEDGNRFGYRIYDHGKKTLDKEVIKPTLSEQDIYDLFDYVFARHHNIDLVGIALPGVAYKGSITEPFYGFVHTNLAEKIRERYGKQIVLFNDVNACALGYRATHENCENMVFHFQPRGYVTGGAGIIIDGHVHLGHMHYAGETKALLSIMCPDLKDPLYSPDEVLQAVMSQCLAYISTIAPEKIVIFSDLTPDMDELHNALAKHIDPLCLPELIHVRRIKRYMMIGMMIRCLQYLKAYPDKNMHLSNTIG